MAPLSVHSSSGGTITSIPRALQRSITRARNREFAATPPPMSSVSIEFSVHTSTVLREITSTTDSWKDAATSATGTGCPEASNVSTTRATAVFSPEKDMS